MNLQYIFDSQGKTTGVFIPIKEWNAIKTQLKEFDDSPYDELTKEQMLHELKEAVKELTLVEQGKLRARPANELLNEL